LSIWVAPPVIVGLRVETLEATKPNLPPKPPIRSAWVLHSIEASLSKSYLPKPSTASLRTRPCSRVSMWTILSVNRWAHWQLSRPVCHCVL